MSRSVEVQVTTRIRGLTRARRELRLWGLLAPLIGKERAIRLAHRAMDRVYGEGRVGSGPWVRLTK